MVPTTGNVVGSASFEMRVDRRKAEQDVKEFERDLKRSLNGMEADANRSASGISAGIGKIGTAVGAVVGFATAAAVALLALGRASFEMAGNISNAAEKIGVSTTVLQEFQYVAKRTGGEVRDAEAAIDGFANKLASAAAGLSKSDVNAFAALKLDQEDLRGFKNTEAALDEVISRIGDLSAESDRAAIAEKLGLGPLSAALREGADRIAELRDEARELGFVMDENLVRKGAEAQEKMEGLSDVIGVQMAGAFIGLSEEVLAFTGYIADAVTGLSNFIDRFDGWKQRARLMYGDDFVEGMAKFDAFQVGGAILRSVTSGQAVRAGNAYENGESDLDDPFLVRQQMAAEDYNNRPPRSPGSSTLTPVVRPPRADRSGERAREREARRSERIEQEIYRAQQRLLDVAEGDLLTARERFDLARDQLHMQREARDAEIKSKIARGEIKQDEAARLRLANEEADILEDRILTDQAILDIRDEELANARLLSDLTADLLSLQSGAARTAEERRRVELELLEITQRQRRNALEQEINKNPSLSEDDKQRIWDLNGRRETGERDAVIRNNAGPLEAWRVQSLKTTAEVREAYQSIAVDGLDALNDGLVDAIMNSRNLGDVFSSVARQILADLLKISIRRGTVEPLANVLFPGSAAGSQGGAGGGGSWFTSVLGSISRGFGITPPAPVSPMAAPFDITAGLSKSAGTAGAMAARPSTIKLEIEEGAMFTARVRQVAGPMVEIGKQQAIGQSVQLARKGSAAQQQRLARLGTP